MASKSSDVRPKITLACTECKERNYITKKNRRNDPDRMELKKFCPRCRSTSRTARRADPALLTTTRPASGRVVRVSAGVSRRGCVPPRPATVRTRVNDMPVDQSLAGRAFPPTQPYRVSAEKVGEFAAATGERRRPGARDVPDRDRLRGDDRLHRGRRHRAAPHRARRAALRLRAPDRRRRRADRDADGATLRQIGGNDIIGTRSEIRDASGDLVCTTTATLVHRGDA